MIEEKLLQGLACPHCGSTGPFKITASFIVNNAVTFLFRNSSLIFGPDSEILCGCNQIGRICDFISNYHQIIPKKQHIKSLEERITALQNSLASMVGHFAFPDFNDRMYSADMPTLQQAFTVLGLSDPFKRCDLIQCFSDHQKQDEFNDTAEKFLK